MGRCSTLLLLGGLLASASARPWTPWDTVQTGNENAATVANEQNNAPPSENADAGNVSDYKDIPASKEIKWVPCFGGNFTCMNLEVPLDYSDEGAGTTNIAFVRSVGGDGSGPDILFNPGGPGSSGTESLPPNIAVFRAIFGDEVNLVSFDPRGVKNSGPAASSSCFGNETEFATLYSAMSAQETSMAERYRLVKAWGERCTAVNAESKTKYIGTSAVVQDMKHFIELQATANGKKAEDAKLWYYGVSYGTVVGQTFAAMFPDKVERMILDANVPGERHYQGDTSIDLVDADAALLSFFDYCAEAGPDKCAFAGKDTQGQDVLTSDQLLARFRHILHKLDNEPLGYWSLASPLPGVLTKNLLLLQAFQLSYTPGQGFPLLAKLLQEVDYGNATTYMQISAPGEAEGEQPTDALPLITCLDSHKRRRRLSQDEFLQSIFDQEAISDYQGKVYAAQNGLFCTGLNIAPPESQQFEGFKETKTKDPILFVNSLRDPITPLRAAHEMATYFPGSAVLAINGTGHGLTAAYGKCTQEVLTAYLKDASLPEAGKICDPDKKPIVDQ
ncbi:alpha/beta-hydrolase [Westerdykella ornata]|uniref:Alpha/beta-hydrolase n=1 Tax=Westerdykella ornata TaxID=318751 RepID=A0A6A6J9V1_WESOR|nr:alpha/beta-hydrolase [Westerdykella ornata]KAF2273370.1 alpha/beta-hydrolase [Westerdykella ornata]